MLAILVLALAPAPPDLAAVGIVVSPTLDRCVAVLRSGGRTRVVGVGDTAFGGRVVTIVPGRVVLEYGGERVELRLPAQAAPAPLPSLRAAIPEDPRTPARAMTRREVERRLAEETPRILAETTIVPVHDEDRVAGFALTRVPEGTLLSDAGLRAGDVLVSINDVPIDSLATLMGLWPRLQSESVLRAEVLRNGQPVSLTVTLH